MGALDWIKVAHERVGYNQDPSVGTMLVITVYWLGRRIRYTEIHVQVYDIYMSTQRFISESTGRWLALWS
jgi:hypothetical protein